MAEFGFDAIAAVREFEEIIREGGENNISVPLKPSVLRLCFEAMDEARVAASLLLDIDRCLAIMPIVKKLSYIGNGAEKFPTISIPFRLEEIETIGNEIAGKYAVFYTGQGKKARDAFEDSLYGIAFKSLYDEFRNAGGDRLVDLENTYIKLGLF